MNDLGLYKSQLKDQNNRMLLAAQEKVRLEKLGTLKQILFGIFTIENISIPF